jgi:hypothetical protein
MNSEQTNIASKIELINDKKVTNPDTNVEIELSSIWKDLKADNLAFIMFFRHWG